MAVLKGISIDPVGQFRREGAGEAGERMRRLDGPTRASKRTIDEGADPRDLAGYPTGQAQHRVHSPCRLTNFGFWRKSTHDSLFLRLVNFGSR
jgi:hypothetical protein